MDNEIHVRTGYSEGIKYCKHGREEDQECRKCAYRYSLIIGNQEWAGPQLKPIFDQAVLSALDGETYIVTDHEGDPWNDDMEVELGTCSVAAIVRGSDPRQDGQTITIFSRDEIDEFLEECYGERSER